MTIRSVSDFYVSLNDDGTPIFHPSPEEITKQFRVLSIVKIGGLLIAVVLLLVAAGLFIASLFGAMTNNQFNDVGMKFILGIGAFCIPTFIFPKRYERLEDMRRKMRGEDPALQSYVAVKTK